MFGVGHWELAILGLVILAGFGLYRRVRRIGAHNKGGSKMAITLKEETILNEWSMLLDHSSGHGDALLDDVQQRLTDARMPGNPGWSVEEVQSSGLFSKVKREFLLVRLEQFKDYRMYVAARDYGVHLDVCRFLTVEPGFFKKTVSEKLTGEGAALSAPKNILVQQDLNAWVTVVHHAVLDAVEALMKTLGQDPSRIRRESKGFLEVW